MKPKPKLGFDPSKMPYRGPLFSNRTCGIWTSLLIFFGLLCSVGAGNNLPLLAGTLRTFQVHACDGDQLKLDCWPGTIISIYFAQYGQVAPHNNLCPGAPANATSKCLAPEALKRVEAACRDQRICRIHTAPESFGQDPCPGIPKYVEVAYKCRPNSFNNKIVCNGDQLKLRCPKTLRLVIYSAMYGSTSGKVPECPSKFAANRDCQVSYATETVMSMCHGRRKCNMKVSVGTFGNPGCPEGSSLYLKVVYTCVPLEILKNLEIISDDNDEDETSSKFFDDHNIIYDINPTEALTTLPTPIETMDRPETNNHMIYGKTTKKPDMQSDENIMEESQDVNCTVVGIEPQAIGFFTEWIAAFNFVKTNHEKAILYLILSVCAGLLAFLGVLASRLYVQKRRERQKAKMNVSEPLPSAFADDAESDLDQYPSTGGTSSRNRPEPGVEVLRYTSRSTMRRNDSDSQPRAPVGGRNTNSYYYS